ncbi:hypothetical protein JCM8208_001947, partial [Rhodotorula glutinis]
TDTPSSSTTTTSSAHRPAIYPVIDASRPVPLLVTPTMTSDFRFLMTHLTPEEQRAQWLAEHGGEGDEGEGKVSGKGEEVRKEGEGGAEEKDEEDDRPVYPLLADPSDPDCGVAAASLEGHPLLDPLSPEAQHAEWCKEQDKSRVAQDKQEQAVQAGGKATNGA